MTNIDITPFGQTAELPDGYPISTSLDENKANKAAAASTVYRLKRMIQSSSPASSTKYDEPVPCTAEDSTKPHHLGQINVIRKALQQCSVKWTPVRSSIPACGSDGTTIGGRKYYPANTQVTGLPYSSTSNDGRAIGSDVTLETFMTAVKNPNSVLYTIDLRDTLSGSLVGAYYGSNCSSFTNYVQGIYAICKGRNNNFGGNKILQFPQSAEAVQIGDLIYLQRETIDSGHAEIVIGIDRDNDGFITQITVAEQDGTRARYHTHTKANFENLFFKGGLGYAYGYIYRNTNLMGNIDFKQEFVGVYDQSGDIPYTYSEAVGINIGNNSNFNKSDNMPIEITLLDPNTVSSFSLYKGTTLIGTYSSSNGVAGYGSTVIVTIDKSQLECGTYEVRPSSGVSQYFCLADRGTIAKTTDSSGNTVITASGYSSNVSPYAVLFYSNRSNNTTRGLWLMEGNSQVTIPKDWLSFINTTNDIAYAQVILRNQYGNIYTEKISL